MTKYFKIKQANRYHLTGGDHINLQKRYRVNKVLGQEFVCRHAAIKGITRLFVVVWKTGMSSNFTDTTYMSQASTSGCGLVFGEKKHIYYRACDDAWNTHAGDEKAVFMSRKNTFLVGTATEQTGSNITAIIQS